MRNFKKTLSFLLSTVIIVSSVVGVGTTAFAATDVHTYKNFKYRILDDNTSRNFAGLYGAPRMQSL